MADRTSRHAAPEVRPAGLRRIDPARLAFDIDGVVANTMQLFLDIVRDRYGINHIRLEDITSYNLEDCLDLDPEVITAAIHCLLQGDGGFELNPLPGCRRVLRRMARSTPRMLFVTARPEREVIQAWLRDRLDLPDTTIEVVATGGFEAKADVLAEAGVKYFVEDRLETCFLLAAAGFEPIVYRQPWNRQPHPFHEVGGWEEIEALIAFRPGG